MSQAHLLQRSGCSALQAWTHLEPPLPHNLAPQGHLSQPPPPPLPLLLPLQPPPSLMGEGHTQSLLLALGPHTPSAQHGARLAQVPAAPASGCPPPALPPWPLPVHQLPPACVAFHTASQWLRQQTCPGGGTLLPGGRPCRCVPGEPALPACGELAAGRSSGPGPGWSAAACCPAASEPGPGPGWPSPPARNTRGSCYSLAPMLMTSSLHEFLHMCAQCTAEAPCFNQASSC